MAVARMTRTQILSSDLLLYVCLFLWELGIVCSQLRKHCYVHRRSRLSLLSISMTSPLWHLVSQSITTNSWTFFSIILILAFWSCPVKKAGWIIARTLIILFCCTCSSYLFTYFVAVFYCIFRTFFSFLLTSCNDFLAMQVESYLQFLSEPKLPSILLQVEWSAWDFLQL